MSKIWTKSSPIRMTQVCSTAVGATYRKYQQHLKLLQYNNTAVELGTAAHIGQSIYRSLPLMMMRGISGGIDRLLSTYLYRVEPVYCNMQHLGRVSWVRYVQHRSCRTPNIGSLGIVIILIYTWYLVINLQHRNTTVIVNRDLSGVCNQFLKGFFTRTYILQYVTLAHLLILIVYLDKLKMFWSHLGSGLVPS